MERAESDLTYQQCEDWMRALGYVDEKKPDWKRLLGEATVKTSKDVLKQRWNEGAAPRDRAKIRARLLEVEAKRKERTPIGRRLLALDEWARIGEALALDPSIIEGEIARLREPAARAREAAEADQKALSARAALSESMKALGSITAPPKGTRK